MSGCKNSTESGCRCYEHAPGLMNYTSVHTPEQRGQLHDILVGMRPSRPVRLNVTTLGAPVEQACTGRLDCSCMACAAAVAERVRRGAQGGGPSSPFKVRRAA